MLDVSVIILTFNEEKHIKRCLDRIASDVKEVFIIDSYSTDKTLELAKEYDVSYLVSDFKKKNGYKTSIELSKKYDLYRQDYCGCAFSKAERELQKQKNVE